MTQARSQLSRQSTSVIVILNLRNYNSMMEVWWPAASARWTLSRGHAALLATFLSFHLDLCDISSCSHWFKWQFIVFNLKYYSERPRNTVWLSLFENRLKVIGSSTQLWMWCYNNVNHCWHHHGLQQQNVCKWVTVTLTAKIWFLIELMILNIFLK